MIGGHANASKSDRRGVDTAGVWETEAFLKERQAYLAYDEQDPIRNTRSRDGRFLINQPVADATAAPITLILNWNPAAKK